MPVHAHADEPRLVERGLTNYWGYNTLAFFVPDPASPPIVPPVDAIGRVQDDGAGAARRRSRSDPGRGLQPHRRRRRNGPDAVVPRHRQRQLLPARPDTIDGATRTSPARATRSTRGRRDVCSSSWTACATGSRRCTSTASVSIWRSSLAREVDEVEPLVRLLRAGARRIRCSRA